MRILVTGRHGQVARSLAERVGLEHELVFSGRPELDLATPASIENVVRSVAPALIISAAAYTAVDDAEDYPDAAYAINAVAPGVLATEARRMDVPIIHLSTDYVFDGTNNRPYREDDLTGPMGVYGRTKLAGEYAVSSAGGRYAIVRTAWVYSPFGRNFLTTMLRLAETQANLRVVGDQRGNPTAASDIADAIFAMVAAWALGEGGEGIFHFAGTGSATWAAFADAIMCESLAAGGRAATISRIATADWPTKAKRPANSQLDCSRFGSVFAHYAPPWRSSAAAVVRRIAKESESDLLQD